MLHCSLPVPGWCCTLLTIRCHVGKATALGFVVALRLDCRRFSRAGNALHVNAGVVTHNIQPTSLSGHHCCRVQQRLEKALRDPSTVLLRGIVMRHRCLRESNKTVLSAISSVYILCMNRRGISSIKGTSHYRKEAPTPFPWGRFSPCKEPFSSLLRHPLLLRFPLRTFRTHCTLYSSCFSWSSISHPIDNGMSIKSLITNGYKISNKEMPRPFVAANKSYGNSPI